LLDDNGVITIAPAIEGASVEAKVLQHLKGDKVIVFKRKEEKDTKEKWSQTVSYSNCNLYMQQVLKKSVLRKRR
jgi:large subunit ribosomal protein L21